MSDDVSRSGEPQPGDASAPARWPLWSSRLHQSLESQESVAAELRRAVEDLRRSLDEPPAPPPSAEPLAPAAPPDGSGRYRSEPYAPGVHRAPKDPSRRSRMRLLLPAGAAVVLGITAAVVAVTARHDTPRRPAPAQAPVQATAVPPLPAWPGRTTPEPPDLAAHGVGADAQGVEVVAGFSADRTVDVYERAVLPPGRTALTLRAAAVPALLRSLDAPPPTVRDLHAEVDGRPVPVTTTTSGWTLGLQAGTPATRLVLRYRLDGAMIRKEPAPPGRFVLVLTPLAPSVESAADPVVVHLRDPRVEDLYCPGARHPLCGSTDGAVRTGTVPKGAVPVVVGLVTFPR